MTKAQSRRRATGSPTGLARKGVILDAASKVFAEKGFSSATVRDIADEAEMLSGSLYYYFESKESVVEEVLVSYLDEMIIAYKQAAKIDGGVLALEGLIGAALRGLVHNRNQVAILQNDWHYVQGMPGIAKRQREIEKIWLATIKRGIESGALKSDHDPRMIFRFTMGSILAVTRWFNPSGQASIEDVQNIYVDILLDGVRA